MSRRQHSVSLDTASAEIFAASCACAHLVNITGVLRFVSFGVLGDDPVTVWCDNEAAVLVANDASSAKRLPFVARRVRLLQELRERGIVHVCGVPGKANPADVLTKYLPKGDFKRYMARLYNCSEDEI